MLRFFFTESIVAIAIALSSAAVFAQDSITTTGATPESPNVQVIQDTTKHGVIEMPITFRAGIAQLRVSAEHYDFTFIDDSPSRDSLGISNMAIPSGGLSFLFGLGIETPPESRLHLGLQGTFEFGPFKFFIVGLESGYNFNPRGNLYIRPKCNLSYGRSQFKIGDIENNAVYIQIDDSLYYGETLEVEATAHSLVATPALDFVVRPKDRFQIGLSLGYQLALDLGKPKIRFSDPSSESEYFRAEKSIDDPNLYFTFDGKNANKLPFEKSGLRAELTFGWYLRQN